MLPQWAVTLTGVAVGGLVSLAAAWLNNRFQTRRWRAERRLEALTRICQVAVRDRALVGLEERYRRAEKLRAADASREEIAAADQDSRGARESVSSALQDLELSGWTAFELSHGLRQKIRDLHDALKIAHERESGDRPARDAQLDSLERRVNAIIEAARSEFESAT